MLDVIEMATDEQLARVGLEKGTMTLIDLATANAVQEPMGAPRYVSGGSVANTTAGIAELGGTAGFVGAVADDEIGRTYSREPAGAQASSSNRTTASRPPATDSARVAASS